MYRLWDVRRRGLHVCDDYNSYFEFVSACASSTGKYGKEYCREICMRSLKYDEDNFNQLYDKQINEPANSFTFGTVNYYTQPEKKTNIASVVVEDWTWEKRPNWIPKGNTRNEEICYIVSSITAFSSIMPHVYFYHSNQRYNLNLYSIIVGELASGKGKCCRSYDLLNDIEKFIKETGDPKKPYTIRETGNITDAMLVYDLALNQDNMNKGSMYIFTPEIDVMSGRKRIGLSSENTRLAWGHERISTKRKGTMDPTEKNVERRGYMVKRPQISIMMTGTPDQLPGYFSNNRDGNLSRYLIYQLDEIRQYHSGIIPLQEDIREDYSDICEMWKWQIDSNIITEFVYTEEQKKRTDELFSSLKEYYALANDKFHNYINRLPIAVRRIAGVISTLRCWEEKRLTGAELYATDEDWDFSIQLVLNNVEMLYRTYNNPSINKEAETTNVQSTIDMLAKMPPIFSSKEFLNLSNQMGYCDRTAFRNLEYLKRNNFITNKNMKRGMYKVVKMS